MATGRVLYVQYTNPGGYPPLVHSARLLADRGFEVLLLGTDALASSMAFPAHPGVTVQLMPFQPGGWLQKLSYFRFASSAAATAMTWRPSWIYASDPLSAPVALMLKQLLGVPVIYHEHDSPSSAVANGETGTSFMKVVMKSRRSLAQAADLCVLPAGERAREFTATTGRGDVHVVWNCPARAEAEPAPVQPAGDALRLLYHGSIVPARVPKEILYAIAVLPPVITLTVVGYATSGHESYVHELTALAAQLGLSDRVRFMGPMSRDELMRRCGDSDAGLSLLPMGSTDINERSMVGASNKPFDYLARGLPVVVSELPDWVETFVTPGFGRSCDSRSPESIAVVLRWMLEHPRERALMGERGRQRILDGWNYDAQFAPVLARMTAGAVDGATSIEAANQVKPTLPC